MTEYNSMSEMGQGNGMSYRLGVGSFVCGAVLGASIALLLAPAEGRETRRRLRGSLKTIKEKAASGIDKVKQQARHVGDGVREGMDTFRHASDESMDTTQRP